MSDQEHRLEALVEGAIVDAGGRGKSQVVQGPHGSHVKIYGSGRAEGVVEKLRGS
ncbi:hypothetical protein AB0C84_45500 [Actinomadura sp. NPDC048955]|uniref:hypothetical protein n=1 Tax=Actinomadura sp. NPDC048955 TaxID=3158228 RepID=UPI0033CF30F1